MIVVDEAAKNYMKTITFPPMDRPQPGLNKGVRDVIWPRLPEGDSALPQK